MENLTERLEMEELSQKRKEKATQKQSKAKEGSGQLKLKVPTLGKTVNNILALATVREARYLR